jgi:hypothetical protein
MVFNSYANGLIHYLPAVAMVSFSVMKVTMVLMAGSCSWKISLEPVSSTVQIDGST